MWTIPNANQVVWLTLLLGFFTGLAACKQDAANPVADPGPAQAIAGTYQARTFSELSSPESYPINGQTVTVQIKRLTASTVQVDIQAAANGKYSPGQNLSYSDASVTSNKGSDGGITYYVSLTPTTYCGYNTLYIYTKNGMDYNFIPPGNPPCSGARIRLEKQ